VIDPIVIARVDTRADFLSQIKLALNHAERSVAEPWNQELIDRL